MYYVLYPEPPYNSIAIEKCMTAIDVCCFIGIRLNRYPALTTANFTVIEGDEIPVKVRTERVITLNREDM